MSDNLTRAFASLLRDWPAQGAELEQRAWLLLVDSLGVAAAGAGEPGPQRLAALARERACRPDATVILGGFATAPEFAARVNGTAMHVLDYEPMWNPPNHALSTIVPALLALAEQRERDGAPPQGARLLRGLLKGVEAQGRLRLASRQIEPRDLTLHPPGVVGPIAAAVACADLLGLDEDGFVNAIGTAASRTGGLMANVGSMTKAMHCGDAASHGLEAALLAARGFTADADALGSPRGYGRAFFGDRFDRDALVAPIGPGRALQPGPAWKLFPSQYATHFAITAALDCHAGVAAPAQIERVTIHSPVMPYIDRPFPKSGLDGKSSLQYGVAAALLDGRVGLASFADARRFAPDMEAMLARVTLRQDPAIPGAFDAMHVVVTVTLAGGATVEHRCAAPIGSWSRPVEASVVEAKARDLLGAALGPEGSRALWAALRAPPEALRIADVMQALAGSG